MIGIFKAIQRLRRQQKEAAFEDYADTCINNQILSAIKKANRRKHQPLNESIPMTVERVDSGGVKTNTEEAGFVKEHNGEQSGGSRPFAGNRLESLCRRKTAACSAILKKAECGRSASKVMRLHRNCRASRQITKIHR